MIAPLRSLMIALWVSCLAGAFLIAALAAGWASWGAFLVCGAAGLLLGVPAGLWTARRIKAADPHWPPRRRRLAGRV